MDRGLFSISSSQLAQLCVIVMTFLQNFLFSEGQTGGTVPYRLPEESTIGDTIGSLIPDGRLDTRYSSDVLRQLRFQFLTEPTIAVVIGHTTGILSTSGRIDRENIPSCSKQELCRVTIDVAVQPQLYFQIIKVVLEIVDVNDNRPQFDQTVFEHSMKESASVGNMFVVPSAVDLDSPQFGIQSYTLMPEDATLEQLFALRVINNMDGTKRVKLQLVRHLDREQTSKYRMILRALDGGDPPLSDTLEIVINVLDSNDHKPEFLNSTYEVSIPENIPPDSTILQVRAVDHDIGDNGRVQYLFSPQTLVDFGDIFDINPNSGEIFILQEVDHEALTDYNLIVTAQDMGPDSQPSDANVIVHVEDVNDNAPTIIVNTLTASSQNRAEIPENSPVGAFVAHLTVTDADSGLNGKLGCKLSNNAFVLQTTEYETEYQIRTTVEMDREDVAQYSLDLECDDFGQPSLRATQHIQVDITDINDHSPFFSHASYTDSIIENNYVGARVLQVNASDEDAGVNADLTYTLSDNVADVFEIEQGTGIISAKTIIDREETSQYRFYVMARDGGTLARSASVSVVVVVEDVNDEGPRFQERSYTFTVDENEEPGTLVGTVTATDRDGPPYNQLLYRFVSGSSASDAFMIDRKSGRILTQKYLDRETHKVYHVTVAAKDKHAPGKFSSTVTVSIYVNDLNDNAPSFLYPVPFNNTVYMSNKVPIGYNITQVRARDPDNGPNGRVSYDIQSGNTDGIYTIDEDSGILSTNIALDRVDYKLSRLQILATDHGSPEPQTIFADMTIIVNKSIPYLPPGSGYGGILSNQNLLIVISVACGCAVVVVILIVAIVCIRRQDKLHRTQRYNCRMEAIGRLTAKEAQLGQEGEKTTIKDQSIPLPIPDGEGTLKVKDTYYTEVRKERIATPSPKVVKKMVHELPAPLHRDLDQLSLHSNEGSNTDSGRGHSEEGADPHHHHHHPHRPLSPSTGPQPHRSTHSSLGQYSVPPPPSYSSTYYPHLKAHAAAHSYSSHPPQKLRSFAPEDEAEAVGRAQAEPGYEPIHVTEGGNATLPYPRPARVLPAHGNGGYQSRAELRSSSLNRQGNLNHSVSSAHGNGAILSEDHNANSRTPTHPPTPSHCTPTQGKALVV